MSAYADFTKPITPITDEAMTMMKRVTIIVLLVNIILPSMITFHLRNMEINTIGMIYTSTT